MAELMACLRGWHVALATAEIEALAPQTKFEAISPRLLVSSSQLKPTELHQIITCSSGVQCFLDDYVSINLEHESVEELLEKATQMIRGANFKGSLAVRTMRIDGRINDFSTQSTAGKIGSIAVAEQFTIDLENPEFEIGLIADGGSNIVACGWLVGNFDDSIGTANRRATERPFFRPISLDPRLARLAVNLACGPIDERAVVDPMTGTGGFAVEAVIMGRRCIAVDMNQEMVDGTTENIAWALQGQTAKNDYHVLTGDACELPKTIDESWHGQISGIVLDPPYGRNSHGSHSHYDLISKTLQSARAIISDDAKLVLIVPIIPDKNDTGEIELLHGQWDELNQLLSDCGAAMIGQWKEHVHGSLSRLILLASIAPLN
jgi:tRNA (guanine10-N2)-dimethyltransferase